MLPSIQTKACLKIFAELFQKGTSIVIRFWCKMPGLLLLVFVSYLGKINRARGDGG